MTSSTDGVVNLAVFCPLILDSPAYHHYVIDDKGEILSSVSGNLRSDVTYVGPGKRPIYDYTGNVSNKRAESVSFLEFVDQSPVFLARLGKAEEDISYVGFDYRKAQTSGNGGGAEPREGFFLVRQDLKNPGKVTRRMPISRFLDSARMPIGLEIDSTGRFGAFQFINWQETKPKTFHTVIADIERGESLVKMESLSPSTYFDANGNILVFGKIAKLADLKEKGNAAFVELSSSDPSGSYGHADSRNHFVPPGPKNYNSAIYFLGVSANRFEDAYFSPLKYCDRDIEALKGRFTKLAEGANQRFFPLIAGQEKADRQMIDGYFEELVKVVSEQDTVVIAVASHGFNLGRGLYLALPTTAANSLQATGLDWTTIIDQVNKMRARRIVVLLDACHAGSFAKSSQEFVQRTKELMQGRSGLTIIAACNASESSLELGEGFEHGAFTQGVLETLDSLDAFEQNFDLWFAELKARVSNLTNGQQNPVVIHRSPAEGEGKK